MTKTANNKDFRRILIIRTDRIGDAILSTPVIEAMRNAYPSAHIAVMARVYAKDVIEGNPYLNEVIIYNKKEVEESLLGLLKFAFEIRRKNFDLALILHPTNSVHLLSFLAGIPRRVGYDRKMGFLLTDRIAHTKQLGEKHEMEYALDLVRHLGISPQHHGPFAPLNPASEKRADELFKKHGITPQDKVLALHPGTSCKSKMWSQERFAQAADELVKTSGFKVLVMGGPDEKEITGNVLKNMKSPAIDLTGISVSQDVSVLKRCGLLITTDCGTMHIAAALGVPLVVIFGRKQAGISPVRFGPVSKKSRVLHKDVGCETCLAHDCTKGFACLQAVSVKEVVDVAQSLLGESHG
ncbi:MAG: lipopolysaccharide heptosyltransferase II [Candidatus Omnitrophica bacterium]|nr:lipopolysaccharide heptosyltransferase II [Candidatus Omnitrophota bacterium]